MTWDGFQREVLAELGHVLYVPASAAPPQQLARDAAPGDGPAMLARLARAAGVDADFLRAQEGIAAVAASLRGDAAAKRALWPRLRALRRIPR